MAVPEVEEGLTATAALGRLGWWAHEQVAERGKKGLFLLLFEVMWGCWPRKEELISPY